MLLACIKSMAQTEPMYSQYMYNMLGVNPAYAGNREATSFNVFQRRQWVGLEGAPQTTSVSIDQSILNKKAGWGIQMYDDKLGVEKADGINLMTATRIRVSEKGIISGGLSFGLMNYRIDLMNVVNRYISMKKISHGIYKNQSGLFPSIRFLEGFRMQGKFKAVSVFFLPHGFKSSCHRFGIAKPTTRSYFGATGDWVPGAFGPFYFCGRHFIFY